MNLMKWDPFGELEDVSNRLNRLFGRSLPQANTSQDMLAMADWAPSVDITETDSAYVVKGEIPGVNKDHVKVTIEDGLLTIQGERKMEKEEKGKKFHRIECSYGSFVRRFQVPDGVEKSRIKADFKDGMVNVTLPKSAKAQAKTKAVNIPLS